MGLVTLHFDITFVTPGLCKIVCCLQAQPMIGVRPTRLFQSNRHVGGDAGMSVQNPGEGMPGDSEHLRGFGNAETERTQACVLNGMAGMRWVLHGHLSIPFRLAIVDQIDIKRIAIFEAE